MSTQGTALEHPDTSPSINHLSESEKHYLLIELNQTRQNFPKNKCIHHLIEEQVKRTPDNVAIIFQDKQLTYKELDDQANQLAGYLQRLGVGPDVLVGLHMEPSLEIMVGLLGILKAGGAYVPMDPDYPFERLNFILQDTRAPVILSQEKYFLPEWQKTTHIICVDKDWKNISNENLPRVKSVVDVRNIAYIIYTSGSTGLPKGVMVSHHNLVHSTYARTLYYQEPVGRYLLLSPFSFDSSVAGIFWPLIQGGTLVLPPADARRDPETITEMIAKYQITHMLCLASHYSNILSAATQEKMASLRTAIVSGEIFSMSLINRHNALVPQAKLYNEYGPTEASVWCIVFNCHNSFPGNKVPIGRPIANTQVYLLDSQLQPVTMGMPGELYIGGEGVAQGYLNRPDLTADKFIPDPFSKEKGKRLYRTGDLARYLPDGNLVFLGREDDQVKIRGYRIELGEIEAVLSQYSNIKELVVLCREDVPGDKRLVAYLVTEDEPVPTITQLREFVSNKLPEYMVPAHFVFLEALPRTPVGKIDKEALPAPAQNRSLLGMGFVAPRTSVEKVLAGIWMEVLNVEQLGVKDNFFELGGNSILSIQLASRIRDNFQVEIPIRTIFEKPTVSELAQWLIETHGSEKINKTAQLLLKVAEMSDEEVELMLQNKKNISNTL